MELIPHNPEERTRSAYTKFKASLVHPYPSTIAKLWQKLPEKNMHTQLATEIFNLERKNDSMRTALEDILTIARGPSADRMGQIERIAKTGLAGNYHE